MQNDIYTGSGWDKVRRETAGDADEVRQLDGVRRLDTVRQADRGGIKAQ